MLLEHRFPDWPAGFTTYQATLLIDALAYGYAPWYAVNPLPPLYGGGFVYRSDPRQGSGVERFRNPWEVAATGWGDCNDLTLYRLLELIAHNEGAKLIPGHTRGVWQGNNIHVLIRRANGAEEDPSIILLQREAHGIK